jgi:hypothetical protein
MRSVDITTPAEQKAILERIEMVGYMDGRNQKNTLRAIIRNNRYWSDEQYAAYRREYIVGMAYSVTRGECEPSPAGLITSVDHAHSILRGEQSDDA